MKKLFLALGVLALIGAGCSSSDDYVYDDTTDTTPVTLAPGVAMIKSDMEILQVAANTDKCEAMLYHFVTGVATETDCEDIAVYLRGSQVLNNIDWSAVQPDGTSAQLISKDGEVVANMTYDTAGLVDGYRLSERFWE